MCPKYRKDESAVFKNVPCNRRREMGGGGEGRWKEKEGQTDRQTETETEAEAEQTQPCNETVEKLLKWIFIEPVDNLT